MLVNTICPNCGAQLSIDDSREQLFCTYCGTKIVNLAQKIEVNQTITQNVTHSGRVDYKIDHSSDPTMNIYYGTIDSGVNMVVRIVDTNQKAFFINGQNMAFHLSPGKHDIVLKIGRKNYNRTIYVPDDYTPVNIYASFDGRARITIDQPNFNAPESGPSVGNDSMPIQTAASKPKPTWMSILGFILSFTTYLSPIAIVFCILDLVKSNGKHPKGLSIAGIIISLVMLLVLIVAVLFGMGNEVS